MSSNAIKRRRLNNNTIFHNKKHERKCIDLINVLSSLAYIKKKFNNLLIVKEICEYVTGDFSGNLINCKGGNLMDPCDGTIHFVDNNNFDLNKRYKNDLLLYNHKCDNHKCKRKVYIFKCKGCKEIAHIRRAKQRSFYSSETILQYDYHACTIKKNCDGIYCRHCYKEGGFYCHKCDQFCCNECIKLNQGYCKCKYRFYHDCNWCSLQYSTPDHSRTKYCKACKCGLRFVFQFGSPERRKKIKSILKKIKSSQKSSFYKTYRAWG